MALTRTINRARQGELPLNPKILQYLVEIPERFRVALDNKDFILFNSLDMEDEDNKDHCFCDNRKSSQISSG
ncbi:hypothetical protein ANN_03141 [Periplaneta americana]|uniref:Uncharacterized protein n=1 Tax=Periplaneta americana TaxID=6978 RepID=A0ABQ8TZV3_PERAM|nr:hypothetical protein ANN_03141 [Periplaneta americana]